MARSFLFLSHDNKIGDAIVLTGLFEPIKQRWPDARVGVLCGPANAFIYQAHPAVDRVHRVGSRSVLARALGALAARWQGYAQLVHFGSDVDSRSLRTIVRLAGPDHSVLMFPPAQPLQRQQTVLAGDWESQHVSERHRAYLDWLGLPVARYRYDLRLPPRAQADAAGWLHDAARPAPTAQIAIACDASTADRSLDATWLARCCARLLAQAPGSRLHLLCASPARHAELGAMAETLHTAGAARPVRVLPLQPDAALALALIAQADLLLSPDTFAVHAASAFNRPVLALYPGDAHTLVSWAPRSQHQRQQVAPPGQPIAALDPAEVAAAGLRLLQQSRASDTGTP